MRIFIRAGFFYIFWVVLGGLSFGSLLFGIPVAFFAGVWSLRLIPELAFSRRPGPILHAVWDFLAGTVLGGLDVALRAYSPRMRLKCGVVSLPPGPLLGSGAACFEAMASLQPGSLPLGPDEEGNRLFHVLDADQDPAGKLEASRQHMVKILCGGREEKK